MADARLCRSWLFVPGDSPRKLEKCWSAGADAIVIDLEDAVAPDRKIAARRTVREAVAAAGEARAGIQVYIRVNASDTGLTVADVEDTVGCRPDGYMIPKVTQVSDVKLVSETLDGAGAPDVALVPIVTESPAAVFRLPELCGSDPRNAAILWGSEDLSAAIGARRVKRPDGSMLEVFSTVRSLALLAGSAAGLGIIDTPVVEIADLDRLRHEATEASWMGFTGKLAIHPAQVPVINEAFDASPEELDRARRLVAAAREVGGSVFSFEGKMIDVPHVVAAERVIARAEARGPGRTAGRDE